MHCSYNHSALLEFDFDPLKAEVKKKRGAATVQDALASSGAATQLRSIQIDLTAAPPPPPPLRPGVKQIWRGNHCITPTPTL